MGQGIRARTAAVAAQATARLELEESLGSNFLVPAAPVVVPPGFSALPPEAAQSGKSTEAPATAHSSAAVALPSVTTAAPGQVALVAPIVQRTPMTSPAAIAPGASGVTTAAQRAPLLNGGKERLEQIAPLCVRSLACTRCDLCKHRHQVVFGDGCLDSDLIFVGDAPGREEDLCGEPFAGLAGEFFTLIIEKGLQRPRNSVFLTTAVKCRPELGRAPRPAEYQACLPYLQEQIALIRPKAIVALGAAAANALCNSNERIEQIRGLWLEFMGIPLLPVYDIAHLYRYRRNLGRNNTFERQFWLDLQTVQRHLASKDEYLS